jgi:predicted HD phosphohydrolase
MADGTREDYELLAALEERFNEGLADRLLAAVESLRDSLSGYQVSRYEHSLQSATRVYRNGESEEMIVACLLHDVGDTQNCFDPAYESLPLEFFCANGAAGV